MERKQAIEMLKELAEEGVMQTDLVNLKTYRVGKSPIRDQWGVCVYPREGANTFTAYLLSDAERDEFLASCERAE